MLDNVKILAVDDHQDTLEALEIMLKMLGAEVVITASAKEALRALQSWTPDVLLCDLVMPEHSGLELLTEIQRQEKPICAIAMSGDGSQKTRREAFKQGFKEFLIKPIEFADLAAIIDKTCVSSN